MVIARRTAAKYCHAPKLGHWRATLRVLEYMKGTRKLGSTFQKGSGLRREMFADADCRNKATDR